MNNYTRARAVIDLGLDVDILTFPHGEDISYDNLHIIRFPKSKLFKKMENGDYIKLTVYTLLVLLKFIFMPKKKYDFVFFFGTTYLLCWILIPFIRGKNIATVYTDLASEFIKWNISKRDAVLKIANNYEYFCLKRFDQVIYQSKRLINESQKMGLAKKKTLLIPQSFIQNDGMENANPPATNNGTEVFTILYTGSFVKIQNLDLIYKTAQILISDNVIFVLAGGSDKDIDREKRLIEEIGVSKNTILLPRMKHHELAGHIVKADIVISPRVFGHDTPIKVFDYLSSGKCILATDLPIHNSILNKDISVLVRPEPKSFADAILCLKSNRNAVNEYSLKAFNYYQENYSFTKMKSNYLQLFQGWDHEQ